jgi:flagellin
MLSLQTNIASLAAQGSLGVTNKTLTTSMTRLSTGFRVNSAMDDAAGLQIATRLTAQTRGQQVAQRNTQNAISMMQTAEGALNEVSDMLIRMKDLATQAADASSSVNDQAAMQAEYDALGEQLNQIMNNTTFGGMNLLSTTNLAPNQGIFAAGPVQFQIGSTSAEKYSLNVSANTSGLNTALAAISAAYATPGTAGTEIGDAAATQSANATSANAKIDTLASALDTVGKVRSALGAAGNRLDHVFNNLTSMVQNTTAAKGRIMDTDYASESATMTTKQMLMQAGTSMLKQANGMSQLALSLMQ